MSRRVWAPAVIAVALFLPVNASGARPSKGLGRAANVRGPLRLHELAPRIVSFASDGRRYAAWQTPGGAEEEKLVLLDTLTGRRRTVTLPGGCHLAAENDEGYVEQSAAAGRFLLGCFTGRQEADRVLNAKSGQAIPLRRGFEWLMMGDRYVEGNKEIVGGEGGKFVSSIATGRVWQVREGVLVDLDRPGAPGEGVICAKLRRRIRKMEGNLGVGRYYGYRHGLLVRSDGDDGEVAMEHCRGPAVNLKGQQINPKRDYFDEGARDFELRGGLLSFDTGSSAEEREQEAGEELSRASLRAYSFASGARYSWRLPGLDGYSSHTAKMVFWIPTRKIECEPICEAVTFAVYGARVPGR